jgi:YEATS family/TIR domain
MSIEVKQETRDKGNGWWSWSVWLDGSKSELDRIDYVIYTLHPTFRVPVRTVRTRANGFRLDSSGWGEFNIKLDLMYKNGKSATRFHHLKFEGAKRKSSLPLVTKPMVFVSSSAADTPSATLIMEELRSKQMMPVDASDLESSASFESSLRKSLQQSVAAVAIISDAIRPWQDAELKLAKKFNVPIYSILVGETAAPESIKATQSVRVKSLKDVSKIADKFISNLSLTLKL